MRQQKKLVSEGNGLSDAAFRLSLPKGDPRKYLIIRNAYQKRQLEIHLSRAKVKIKLQDSSLSKIRNFHLINQYAVKYFIFKWTFIQNLYN